MFEALSVFIAGISGVFMGMAMLYGAIKIVSGILSKFDAAEGEK